jgi:MscS family membrane protein
MVVLGEVFAVNVTALIGGLGIGGLAVAFAAKESLENLIASFTIFLDQPFGVGDLVQASEVNGTVEKIGFRSTRLRTAEKSYVTVPNKSMIDKPLDNLSLRTARRVGFTLTFEHKTTSAQLHAILKKPWPHSGAPLGDAGSAAEIQRPHARRQGSNGAVLRRNQQLR